MTLFLSLSPLSPWLSPWLSHSDGGMLKGPQSIITPHEANQTELLFTHTERYLNSLNVSEELSTTQCHAMLCMWGHISF